MAGFVFKIVLFFALVASILFFSAPKLKNYKSQANLSLPRLTDIGSVSSSLKNIDMAGFRKQLSGALDNLVTHSDRSPVVLGMQISDNSLDTVVNLIRNLPPDQLSQIKSYICQPATPSAK